MSSTFAVDGGDNPSYLDVRLVRRLGFATGVVGMRRLTKTATQSSEHEDLARQPFDASADNDGLDDHRGVDQHSTSTSTTTTTTASTTTDRVHDVDDAADGHVGTAHHDSTVRPRPLHRS